MNTLKLPVKLNDRYTCQGIDGDGEGVVFDDLLYEGEHVATRTVGDDLFGPWGAVVRKSDGLWVVPCGCETALYPAEGWDTTACEIHGGGE